MDTNERSDQNVIMMMSEYIVKELEKEMVDVDSALRVNKIITLMQSAESLKNQHKKITFKRPLSSQQTVHEAIVAYFAKHDVTVEMSAEQ